VQGSGCYGHNGADDAAADCRDHRDAKAGTPIRVRWRREEEFVYEPKSPSMVVKVRALLDDAGKPSDWTQEIWSGNHNGRPGGGNSLLGEEALPGYVAPPPANEVPEAAGGGATRNADPLYDIPDKRIVHHKIVRTAGARVGAARPRRHRECLRAGMLHRRAGRARRARPGRVSPVDNLRSARPCRDRESRRDGELGSKAPGGEGHGRGFAFARYRTRPPIAPSSSNSTSMRKFASTTSGAPPMLDS